jgi:hypothetical protein
MDPEAVPNSSLPRLRARVQRLALELDRDWGVTVRLFDQYRDLAPHRRFRALGELFERLCPWIERGLHSVAWNNFVLIPTEQAVSRAFAHTTQKESLPRSYVLYIHWIESMAMRGLARREEAFVPERDTPGDPGARICARFNSLPYNERQLLYLYVVEGCSATEVADNTGMPYPYILETVPRLWDRVAHGEPRTKIPVKWQIPITGPDGELVVATKR